jgi:tetratricopeptide (TPR) repeat protein
MFSLVLEAQTDVTIRRKDFNVDETGFSEAWKHVATGDSYFNERGIWYGSAFDEYLQAIVYNNSNPELNYKTGASALFSDRKEEAAAFLLKALDLKPAVAEDILLLTGQALQFSGRYAEAIEKFDEYLIFPEKKSKEDISLARKCLDECNSAIILTKDTLRIGIDNMGANINSSADDYSEIFSFDGEALYFGSRRELPESGKRYPDTKFDENIFSSVMVNGSWGIPAIVKKDITTKLCESPLYINSSNDILYVYTGYKNGGDIMMSKNKKGLWRTPEPVPFKINSNGSETSFTFSPSGNEIYFVTDNGKDNIGGKDIYYIKKINEQKWSKPQNAGPAINTVFDEESVRFSNSGDTLWFSSKGHNSIGGFDIFYSIKKLDGEWDYAKNYGYPVNTPWNEIFYHPSPVNDSLFYFVSNRSGGLGGLDIYQGRILPSEPVFIPTPEPDTIIIRDTVIVIKEVVPPPPEEEILFLIGTIRDSETKEPVLAQVDVTDLVTNIFVATTISSDKDGSYRVRLPEKKSYMINLRAPGFLSDMKSISISDSYMQDFYTLDVSLVKFTVGKKVVLNNILFETGKSILTSGSYTELNRLFKILQDNPLMKIEISGHTDKTGSEAINFKLSGARAKSVVDYLVQMGVSRTRLEFRGFGSLQPIADNATPAGRAKNRRVEFKILEF